MFDSSADTANDCFMDNEYLSFRSCEPRTLPGNVFLYPVDGGPPIMRLWAMMGRDGIVLVDRCGREHNPNSRVLSFGCLTCDDDETAAHLTARGYLHLRE
jgi:hypothetical protein